MLKYTVFCLAHILDATVFARYDIDLVGTLTVYICHIIEFSARGC